MTYEVCKRCGKMFEKNRKVYCKTCFEKNAKEYDLIINYVRKHPTNATVLDVIKETGVSLKSINCLVDDGGIFYVENKVSITAKNENPSMNSKKSVKSKFHLTR